VGTDAFEMQWYQKLMKIAYTDHVIREEVVNNVEYKTAVLLCLVESKSCKL